MSTGALLARAGALLDVHRPDEALVLIHQALGQDPHNPVAHLLAARAHIAAERWDAAGSAAGLALQADPESSDAALLLAVIENGAGDFDAARAWAIEAVRLGPDRARAHALLAQLDAGKGNDDDAVERAIGAVGLAPDDAFVHLSLGVVLHRSGRYAAAEQALRAALALDPQDSNALSTLGETLAARGRPADAAELLQLAARANVRDETIQQDMLRYVRGAAWGLATLPVMLLILVITLLSATSVPSVAIGAATLVAVGGARVRRLSHFPPEVRRLLNRRARQRSAWESAGPAGFRPWWWRILVRTPLAARAVACWLAALAFVAAPDEEATTAGNLGLGLAFVALAGWVTYLWWRARRHATATLDFYDAS
ncbi:Beta-barrel assembly-enhancing protease [Paraconexibacter sp. AEG42_29]|uniref:Beta-barrel assembly-enhancing protease n=1 Tax=Paraconexibacter sp. AEG42_29 TaxID=2997339 RepID=A0AAU7AVN7_9ACTN